MPEAPGGATVALGFAPARAAIVARGFAAAFAGTASASAIATPTGGSSAAVASAVMRVRDLIARLRGTSDAVILRPGDVHTCH